MNRLITVLMAVGLVVGLTLILAVFFSAIMAFPVMWLWNYLFVTQAIFGTALPALNFWSAWALLILCQILIKTDVTVKNKGD